MNEKLMTAHAVNGQCLLRGWRRDRCGETTATAGAAGALVK
jgi:hypothetical protein